MQVPLCLAVEDLWRVKIRARLGEDAQYRYVQLKIILDGSLRFFFEVKRKTFYWKLFDIFLLLNHLGWSFAWGHPFGGHRIMKQSQGVPSVPCVSSSKTCSILSKETLDLFFFFIICLGPPSWWPQNNEAEVF